MKKLKQVTIIINEFDSEIGIRIAKCIKEHDPEIWEDIRWQLKKVK